MALLKRAGVLALGTALAVVVGHGVAAAQDKEIRGNAVAVSDSSLTVKAGDQTLTFVIDKTTLVEAKGAGTRSRQAEAVGKSAGIKVTDYVKAGDPVLVSYRQVNGKNQAIVVRPVSSAGSAGSAAKDSLKNVQGRVKSINGGTLIAEQGGRDVTYAIDRDTDVKAVGATRATKQAGGTLPITDIVHVGDLVRIEYQDVNGSMKAREIQVLSRATIPAK
jgi:hypothetical protein